MTSNDELERQGFEEWYCRNYRTPLTHMQRHDKSGDYFDRQTRAAWRAWLARSKQEQSDGQEQRAV